MSQQPMNLRRVTRIALHRKRLVGGLVIAGIAAGASYTLVRPPTLTSSAVVVLNQPGASSAASSGTLSNSNGLAIGIETDILIAESRPVLSAALSRLGSGLTLKELTSRVSVVQAAPGALSFTANAPTAVEAEKEANAVADSFITYIGSSKSPISPVQAHLLSTATSATSPDRVLLAVIAALIGAVLGLTAGLVAALRLDRRDPGLRERDEIASSIGVPVIASLPAEAPSDTAGWTRLFTEYEPPSAVHAWRLRATLNRLGVLTDDMAARESRSLCVLSLASDGDALALGPQIAAFTAGLGVRTAFTIEAPHEAAQSAALRTACTTSSGPIRGGNLLLTTDAQGEGKSGGVPGARLTVITTVVDLDSDQLPDVVRASAAVLCVSSGGASGEQLAQAAAFAADSGTLLAGLIVVNPDPEDKTMGLVPRPARPARHALPTKHENAREVRIGDRTRPADRAAHGSR